MQVMQRATRLFFSTHNNNTVNTTATASQISHYFSLLNTSPNLKHLKHIHANLLRTSLYNNAILSSKLVLSYSQHDHLVPNSLSVFFHMPHRNIFSWNIIMGEFSRSCFPEKALDLFVTLWRESNVKSKADAFTFPLVLRACAGSGYVRFGGLVHGLCVKLGFEGNLFVGSALVFMYVTFGRVWDAREVFVKIPKRDAVLWTAMLAGYAQHQEAELGLGVFREMVECRVQLDGVVMVSLLLVCGQKGWLKHGKSVHGWCVRRCFELGLSLGNAVVDMYVKCAGLGYAYRVLVRMAERDVISWSSIILGYGLGGGVDMAFLLFEQMKDSGIKPNDVTFLGVLSACAHGGLVDRARSYFVMMKQFGVVAELKHYACMVDCLSRAGLLEEAERFIEDMPLEPDGAVLGALVGGCRVHRNFEVGERVAKKLIRLEPEKPGYYVLLSNIYAEAGRFDDAEKVRNFMKESNLLKLPGRSLVESEDPPFLLQQNQG